MLHQPPQASPFISKHGVRTVGGLVELVVRYLFQIFKNRLMNRIENTQNLVRTGVG